MQALVLTAPHAFEIGDIPKPEPKENEVLCRVKAIAICGTDAEIIEGSFKGRWPKAYPFTPGHEWSGEVVSAGPVALEYGFTPGTRVAGTSHSGCGYCRMCRTGRYNLCFNYGREDLGHRQYGHYTQGAYAEYVVQTIKSVFTMPDTMPFDVGALCDTASIALHSAKRAGIEPGDVIASVGSGGMGLLAAMCAKALGAARVIVVGGGKRLDRARDLGFEVVDYHSGDPVAAVRALTGGRGVDAAIDSAGTADSIKQSIGVLRKGGRVAFTGIPREPVQIDMQKIVLEELDLHGVRANRNTMEEVMPLMTDGRIPAAKLITHHFALSDFREALRTFNERVDGALKVIVEP
ncbi:MAG: zinc-binding dehydrogenase [Chloroflexota bacterium]